MIVLPPCGTEVYSSIEKASFPGLETTRRPFVSISYYRFIIFRSRFVENIWFSLSDININ